MNATLLRLCALLSTSLALHAGAQTPAEAVALWNGDWAQYLWLESVPLATRGYVEAAQDLSIVIEAPLKTVMRIYSNVDNSLGLHPFLKAVVPVRRTELDGVPTYDFIAYEDIPLADGTLFHGVTVAQQRFHLKAHYYDADSYDVPGIVTTSTSPSPAWPAAPRSPNTWCSRPRRSTSPRPCKAASTRMRWCRTG